ncbi:hypothetical protein ACFSSF_15490 [Dietzia aerolata]|uniref:hypothetical protein n=1 Tax=Dietzia aerolata TaxID=595984 RepID=UPI00362FB7ED
MTHGAGPGGDHGGTGVTGVARIPTLGGVAGALLRGDRLGPLAGLVSTPAGLASRGAGIDATARLTVRRTGIATPTRLTAGSSRIDATADAPTRLVAGRAGARGTRGSRGSGRGVRSRWAAPRDGAPSTYPRRSRARRRSSAASSG